MIVSRLCKELVLLCTSYLFVCHPVSCCDRASLRSQQDSLFVKIYSFQGEWKFIRTKEIQIRERNLVIRKLSYGYSKLKSTIDYRYNADGLLIQSVSRGNKSTTYKDLYYTKQNQILKEATYKKTGDKNDTLVVIEYFYKDTLLVKKILKSKLGNHLKGVRNSTDTSYYSYTADNKLNAVETRKNNIIFKRLSYQYFEDLIHSKEWILGTNSNEEVVNKFWNGRIVSSEKLVNDKTHFKNTFHYKETGELKEIIQLNPIGIPLYKETYTYTK